MRLISLTKIFYWTYETCMDCEESLVTSSGRSQYLEIEGIQSYSCEIECEVPQCSIFGQLLYVLYVNDIAKSTVSNILPFADDTSLFLYCTMLIMKS